MMGSEMAERTKTKTAGVVIGVAGMSLIIWQLNWLVALGLLMVVWGNNVERLVDDID